MQSLIIILVLFWIIPAIIRAVKGKKGQKQGTQGARTTAHRQTPSVQLNRPVPSMNRPTAARSAHRDFSAPEAPCIVCENTGDDHFQRDKVRRIAQLDDWLKNGLIDREEYRVMKDRYQRGI